MLKPYDVVLNGAETTLLLTDEDAARRGLTAVKAKTVPNKSRKPANKAG